MTALGSKEILMSQRRYSVVLKKPARFKILLRPHDVHCEEILAKVTEWDWMYLDDLCGAASNAETDPCFGPFSAEELCRSFGLLMHDSRPSTTLKGGISVKAYNYVHSTGIAFATRMPPVEKRTMVPAGWGDIVLDLVSKGIGSVEYNHLAVRSEWLVGRDQDGEACFIDHGETPWSWAIVNQVTPKQLAALAH